MSQPCSKDTLPAIDAVLSTIALIVDEGPCRAHREHASALDAAAQWRGDPPPFNRERMGDTKLLMGVIAGVEDLNTKRALHMLLSLVFDMWRRNEYLYEALRCFAETTRPDQRIATLVAAHSALIAEKDGNHGSPSAINWGERARFCSNVVHRMLDDTERDHLRLLERYAGSDLKAVVEAERLAIEAKDKGLGDIGAPVEDAAGQAAVESAGGGGAQAPTDDSVHSRSSTPTRN